MFDKVYLFVITSVVYVLSGALAGKVAFTWGIRDLHTIRFWIFAVVWAVCTVIIVQYNLYKIRRKNK